MRSVTVVLCFVATLAAAQEPTHTDSLLAAPPTLEQLRYLDGLRTAGRGVAQIKDGVSRVSGLHRDTVRLKQAARRLAGLCGAARGFMTTGRARMQATVYQDSTGIKARRLTIQIDSLIRSITPCEKNAARQPDSTVTGLMTRLRGYEAALRDFRTAIGLPNR